MRTGVLLSLAMALVCSRIILGDFPQPFNTEPDPQATPLTAVESAARLTVPPNMNVTLFAAEPDVQNPIAAAWDGRGRLWIAENYTYAERAQRFELSLHDRVVILEDADRDGCAETRHVFSDEIQMLTSVEVGRDGVWLMCPPQLLFLPDRDHDDRPDGPAEVMVDGFEVAQDNYHNFANGLRWGPDGWLYGRCGGSCPGRIGLPGTPDEMRLALEGGLWRYRPASRTFPEPRVEVLTTGTTNPWGHDWNELYEAFFVNTVNGHLWHLIPGSHLVRPFTLDPNSRTYSLIDLHADHWHFDTGKSWTDSRDGAASSYGGGHAHTGAMIYLGDNWPDSYRDKLLTFNIHGRRANQEQLDRHGSGYLGRHRADVLFSSDPWFRGMELTYGPAGDVYALDWSDTGECHESNGVHRTSGRVYRISASGEQGGTLQQFVSRNPRGTFDLENWTSEELVQLHSAKNEWFVRTARRILADRARERPLSADIGDALRTMSRKQTVSERDRLRALLTLHCIGEADEPFLLSVLQDSGEHIRTWGVRLLTDAWPLDDALGPVKRSPSSQAAWRESVTRLLPRLIELGRTEPSSLVRLALASTLQRLPVEYRASLAVTLVRHTDDADDHNLPLMVWYGLIPLIEQQPSHLVDVFRVCTWSQTRQFLARGLAEVMQGYPEGIDQLLITALAEPDTPPLADALQGMSAGLRGLRKARSPIVWDQVIERSKNQNVNDLEKWVQPLSVLFGDGRALAEVRTLVLDSSTEPNTRIAALQTLIQSRPVDLRDVCTQLLDDARLNVVAASGMAQFDDPEVGRLLVKSYRKFRSPTRSQLIAILVSRSSFAHPLLDAIEEEQIPAFALTPFDVRQLHTLEDPELDEKISRVWGDLHDTSAEKQASIRQWRARMTDQFFQGANVSQGRALFQEHCSKCHRLFGDGDSIGPDLTGGNRYNLDYLLENVLDPSSVVPKDFRMTVCVMKDGRVFNGLIAERTERSVTLQTPSERVTLVADEIETISQSSLSPMPDGLWEHLNPEQVRDLVSYLRHPTQVPLPTQTSPP